jgi:hypothetical protein
MANVQFDCTITLPITATFVNLTNVRIATAVNNQWTTTNSTIPIGKTQDEFITYIGFIFSSAYGLGGAWTYTKTTVGSENIYAINYTVTDTNINLFGEPTFIGIRDDNNNQYSAAVFKACDACAEIVCPTCQELTKSACEDEYTFVAGLTPSTVYYVVIENNRNKRYVQAVTTDGSGDFAIDASATGFPLGFFIAENLKYTIKVYSDSTLMLQQDITVGSTIYKCITLGFVNTVTTTASANFGVDFLIDDELNFIVDDLGNTFSV